MGMGGGALAQARDYAGSGCKWAEDMHDVKSKGRREGIGGDGGKFQEKAREGLRGRV